MLVWSEFCQEMFACLAECEPAVLVLCHSCQRDRSWGKAQKPFGEGRCRAERAAQLQLQPYTLPGGHRGCAGRQCLYSLGCSNCGEGPECHLLSELEQAGSWLAVGRASRRIPSFSPLFTESHRNTECYFCMPLCSSLYPNCHGTSASADFLHLHTAVSKHALCATVQWRFFLLSLLLWGPSGSCQALSLLDNTGAASFSFWLSGTELMLCAAPLHVLSAARIPVSPGRARWSHPSLGDSFTTSASHFHMMSLNIIKQKGPTSWSWTES